MAATALCFAEEPKKEELKPLVNCYLSLPEAEEGKLGGWMAKGEIKVGDRSLFHKYLPLASPATRDEAWKACIQFLDKTAPKILKDVGYKIAKQKKK